MGSESLLGVELPKDANGKVIPLDTEILYEKNGQVFYVSDFRYSPKAKEWFASGNYTGRKNGWSAETEGMGGCENGFKCSECGNTVEDYEGFRISGEFNYCSKCGAEVVE